MTDVCPAARPAAGLPPATASGALADKPPDSDI